MDVCENPDKTQLKCLGGYIETDAKCLHFHSWCKLKFECTIRTSVLLVIFCTLQCTVHGNVPMYNR